MNRRVKESPEFCCTLQGLLLSNQPLSALDTSTSSDYFLKLYKMAETDVRVGKTSCPSWKKCTPPSKSCTLPELSCPNCRLSAETKSTSLSYFFKIYKVAVTDPKVGGNGVDKVLTSETYVQEFNSYFYQSYSTFL